MEPSVWLLIAESISYFAASLAIISSIIANMRLFKISNEMFIQKRGKITHFGLNFTLTLQLLLATSSMITRAHFSHIPTAILVTHIAIAVAFWSFLYFSIVKSWLIYFKERWTFYTLQSEWQQIINTKIGDNHDNWYIKHHQKYGSFYNIARIVGYHHIVGTSLCIFAMVSYQYQLLNPLFNYSLIVIPFFITAIIYVTIICKTPRLALVDDIFLIHWESKLHSRLQVLYNILIVSQGAAMQFLGEYVSDLIFIPLMIITIYIMLHISSWSLIQRLHKSSNDETMLAIELSLQSEQASASKVAIGGHSESTKSNKTVSVLDILASEEALHLFMLHLSKEYSMECLLSLLEITQYQQYAVKLMMGDDEEQNHLDHDIAFPEQIVHSEIVADEHMDFKEKAYKLYSKYIKIGAEFEINISYDKRKEFFNLLDDEEFLMNNQRVVVRDIFGLFEYVQTEMLMLLKFSLARFKQREEFTKISALFTK